MNILCTGGCGYVGSVLVPTLLAAGHRVDVIDVQWFGNPLQGHSNLAVLRDDIRNGFAYYPFKTVDCVIHLAAVANDPCCELDPKLTWEVNALGTELLLDAAERAGVQQFIYASSGSVYGVKPDGVSVVETVRCVPLSEYNKTKMVAERLCLSYSDKMTVQILRPATVCGYSPRTRLDVAVNALTISALAMGEVKVFGGAQMRPNLHIADMVGAYMHMLEHPELKGIYNVGFENYSLLELGKIVQGICGGILTVVPSTDARSYRLNSQKIIGTGFEQRHRVVDAINELKQAFEDGRLKDTDNGYNLRTMPR